MDIKKIHNVYFIGIGGAGILVFVLPKAWAEIVFTSFLMAALIGNQGFTNFIATYTGYKTKMKT